MDIKDALQTLQDAGYLSIFWHKQDIVKAFEVMDIEATDDLVDEVAEFVEDNFDAEIGFNWETLYNAVNELQKNE